MLGKVEVTIKGLCPLLQHNPAAMHVKNPHQDKSSQEFQDFEYEHAKYTNKNGLYEPATHIKRAMEEAGKNKMFKIGSGKGTYSKPLKGGIFINPEGIKHVIQKSEPYGCWVVVQKARIWRIRAMLKDWELNFSIDVIDDRMNLETLKNVLDYAGKYIGIGDNRPECGRFEIEDYKKAKSK